MATYRTPAPEAGDAILEAARALQAAVGELPATSPGRQDVEALLGRAAAAAQAGNVAEVGRNLDAAVQRARRTATQLTGAPVRELRTPTYAEGAYTEAEWPEARIRGVGSLIKEAAMRLWRLLRGPGGMIAAGAAGAAVVAPGVQKAAEGAATALGSGVTWLIMGALVLLLMQKR